MSYLYWYFILVQPMELADDSVGERDIGDEELTTGRKT